MKPNNPFPITDYLSPKYFCNRNTETARLISAFENNRNLTLFAIRRIGKTGLIKHVIHKYSTKKNVAFIYIDLMPTNDLTEFTKLFGETVIQTLESKSAQFLKKVTGIFGNLRPKISYDSLTGEPSLELTIQNEKEALFSLNGIFNYLNDYSKNKKIVIALDEFQQIANYPEENVEALLRANIQKSKNVSFIFCGSHKHMLLSIFGEYKRPFYQSTEMMSLDKIKETDYIPFIEKHFAENQREISEKDIAYLYDWTRGHTYYIQYVCNKLFGSGLKKISNEDIRLYLKEILKENENLFYNYRIFLTEHQWKLLIAVSKEGGIDKPLSKEFIKKYNLNASSSVQSSLKGLLEKEMIYHEEGMYYVYDVFLARWLERL